MESSKKREKIRIEVRLALILVLLVSSVIVFSRYRKMIPVAEPKIVVILPGETNDQSWNKANYEGILACQKKAEKEKFSLEYQSNVAEKDFESVIRKYAKNGYNLIILAGSQFEDIVSSVSGDYPEVDFCILNGRSKVGRNVFSVYPKEEEASHLAGIIAGNITQTGILGTIAGYPNEAMETLLDQYEKDVRQLAADRKLPNAEVLRAYANSWEDEELGKEIADQMIGKGADVLFIYANNVGNGCIEAARENGVKVIGFSEDQNDLAPGTVVASIKFDFEKIYTWIFNYYMNGKLNGNQVYGVGVDEGIFTPIYTEDVPMEVQQAVNETMKKDN